MNRIEIQETYKSTAARDQESISDFHQEQSKSLMQANYPSQAKISKTTGMSLNPSKANINKDIIVQDQSNSSKMTYVSQKTQLNALKETVPLAVDFEGPNKGMRKESQSPRH